ncbi:MAG: hypothetical protein LIO90_09885 [Bacteroidales bacterium]|nr:hypothetical protein [Bacteroidales bacterium]
MKQYLIVALSLALCLPLGGCKDDETLITSPSETSSFTISAIGASIDGGSRVTYTEEYLQSGLGDLKVAWEAGDSFKLYEATGDDYTTPKGTPLATFTIKDEYDGLNYGIFISDTQMTLDKSIHYLAVWEMAEEDDCPYIQSTKGGKKYLVQYGDGSTTHLKYGDKMIAKISYTDNTINTGVDGVTGASFPALDHGNVTPYIHFYHPEHFVMRVRMNGFLYDIPEGALLRVFGLKGLDLSASVQVRLQCAGSSKGATTGTLIDVTEADSSTGGLRGVLGYSTPESEKGTTFVAYLMCEEDILEDVDQILFSLCDDNNDDTSDHGNSSQDRYVWQLQMPGDFSFKHGEFWKFDLTEYTCRPAIRLNQDNLVCWGVTDLGSNDISEHGYFYQVFNPTPVAKDDTEILTADLSAAHYYTTFFKPTYGYTQSELESETSALITNLMKSGYFDALAEDYCLAGIFKKTDGKFGSTTASYNAFNGITEADVVYQSRGGMWRTPTAPQIDNMIRDGDIQVESITTYQGSVLCYNPTRHKIFLKWNNNFQESASGNNVLIREGYCFLSTLTFATNVSSKTSTHDRITGYMFPSTSTETGNLVTSLTTYQLFKATTLRPVLDVESMNYAFQ